MTSALVSMGLVDAPAVDESGLYPRVVTATIIAADSDVAELKLHDGTEALLPITEFYPDRSWKVGETYQLVQSAPGPRPICSATRPELVPLLLAGVSPELRSGDVVVMGVAREPGKRTKLAVAATRPEVDSIAACVGRAANRSRDFLGTALLGEKVDIISWHADKAEYLRNALKPADVHSVAIEDGKATAVAPAHQMSAAVGERGLNSSLAGRLVGLQVLIVPGDR